MSIPSPSTGGRVPLSGRPCSLFGWTLAPLQTSTTEKAGIVFSGVTMVGQLNAAYHWLSGFKHRYEKGASIPRETEGPEFYSQVRPLNQHYPKASRPMCDLTKICSVGLQLAAGDFPGYFFFQAKHKCGSVSPESFPT
ncbi:hypothetical protein AVEN_5138-1 [Araneus ventricosus]|uniref:Uncharacterized protein n=1 Tax=Araneus ventricosus TaxID=182803 RepID=A0A4Y2JNA7_ARAVE|nr:hypothetical protein AVEN_5138-1 [Araneus ventricosus]